MADAWLSEMCNQLTAIRTFDSPVGRVHAAWTSSTTLVPPVSEVEMNAIVGGQVRVSTGGHPSEDLVGVFIAAEANQQLVYTWRWGNSPEETLVDVRFHAVDDHRTVVEVRHRGFLDDASRETHLSGWVSYFDGLAGYL